ncbi:MAG TPA: sensor histidine kinase KdpD [Ktedonobacterales bacterium]
MAEHARSHGDERPDPDALLDRYQLRDLAPTGDGAATDSSHPQRGRLRIYLGMAAGVGKTYAMLNEGRRRKSRGTDVVAAWVETHGRALTAQQLGDLEVIPRRRISYRGVELEEMDLDAVLARKPAVALVDELAHTNAHGSRHEKRYQDVEELLAAGITVITTVNVQHLEGLNDLVEAITGARQRETIPDRLLDEAYDVELVDISPEALRARLRHGNVYPPERARLALERYFSISNLTALRDLALQRVSAKTEQQLEALMQTDEVKGEVMRTAPVNDRVLVVFEAGPHVQRLLHEGWRMAHALRAPLYALAITSPGRLPQATTESAAPMTDCVRMAEDVGAEVIATLSAERLDSIAQFVRERRISLVIVSAGPPASGWLRARPTLASRLLSLRLCASVLVVPAPRDG